MTLVFILLWASVDKSPFHILFNICPYSGSSLKRWLLSNIMIALMQLSKCLLDKLENIRSNSIDPTGSSWQKTPANMIENPPKGFGSVPNFLQLYIKCFKNFTTHEWYFINNENLYILPFIFVVETQCLLLIEKCGLWDCDTTKQWCCRSCLCNEQECCITPHDTPC